MSESSFERAVALVGSQKRKPDQETQLALYGLYKCATVGPAAQFAPTPSLFDFAGQAKVRAWTALGDLAAEEARLRYCRLVERVFGEGPKSSGGGGWDFFQGQEVREAASKKHAFWDTQPMPNKFNEDTPPPDSVKPELIDPRILDHQGREPLALDPALDLEWCLEAWADASLGDICKQVHELSQQGEQGEIMSFSPSISFLVWSMSPPGMQRRYLAGLRRRKTHELVGFICALPMGFSIDSVKSDSCVEIKNLFVHPDLRGNRLAPILIAEATRRVVLDGHYTALYTSSVTITKPLCKARYYQRPINMAKLVSVRFKEVARGQTLARMNRRYAEIGPLPPGWQRMDDSTLEPTFELLQRHWDRFPIHGKLSREQFRYWFLDCHESVHAYVIKNNSGNVTAFCSWHVLNANVESNAGCATILSGAFSNYCAVDDASAVTLATLYDAQVAQLVRDGVDVLMLLDIGGWEDVLLDFEHSKAEVTPEYLLYHLYNFRALPRDPEDFNIYFF